jgi:hypothetical protein
MNSVQIDKNVYEMPRDRVHRHTFHDRRRHRAIG